MQRKQKKWIGLLILGFLAILLSSVVDSTPIAQRAIVAGLAIDCEGKTIEVTAQILVASGSGSTANAKQVSAKGETISGAVSEVSKKTSMAISLAHCNLVILGGGVLRGNAYRVLDYLVRNAYLSENSMLVGTEGAGKDILNTKVAFSEQASFFAQRTLYAFGTFQGIAKRSIKSFVVDYNKAGSANYIPLIERSKEPLEDSKGKQQTEGSGGTQPLVAEGDGEKPLLAGDSGGGTGSAGNSGSAGGAGAEYLFDMTKTAIIKGESMVLVLDENGTTGLNYVLNDVKRGAITVPTENGNLLELYVIGKKIDRDYLLDTRGVHYDLTLDVIYKEELKADADKTYHRTVKLTEQEEKIAAEIVKGEIKQVFEASRALEVDIFEINNSFRRKYGRKAQVGKEFLDSVNLEIEVKFKYN